MSGAGGTREGEQVRLLGGEATDFEQELLGSWKAEQPSDAAREKVLAMVGLAGVAGAAGAGGLAAKGAGSVAPKAAAIGSAALAKWLVVGAIGGSGLGAAIAYTTHARQAGPEASAPLSAPPHAAATNDGVANGATETPPPASALPTATPLPSPPHSPSSPARAHPSEDALGEQVAALDRARRALANGDTAGTLRELDDYEARFPRGVLVEEAEVLRIRALLAANDTAAAARVGSRFLASHPGSAHAARIRALLGQAPAP